MRFKRIKHVLGEEVRYGEVMELPAGSGGGEGVAKGIALGVGNSDLSGGLCCLYVWRDFTVSSGADGFAPAGSGLSGCFGKRGYFAYRRSGEPCRKFRYEYDDFPVCNGGYDRNRFFILPADPEKNAFFPRICTAGVCERICKGRMPGICDVFGGGRHLRTDGILIVFLCAKGGFSGSFFTVYGRVVQGMAEEVLCRGYFLVSVGRRYPMSAAVLFNSCAFAALHLLNPGISPLAVANLILFGIFASICFIRTENIWLVGAVHSVWNLVQGNVYGGNVSGMKTSCSIFSAAAADGREIFHGGEFGLEGGIAVTVVLLAAILLLLFWKHNNQRESAMEEV